MIEKINGVSTVKQRQYLKAENKAHDILKNNGYIAHGNAQDHFKTVCVFKKITAYHNQYIGKYKNFQEAKEILIDGLKHTLAEDIN